MSNKHQAVILIVNTKEEMPESLNQMIAEGNTSLLVLRRVEGGLSDTQLFNAVTSISQLTNESLTKPSEAETQSIIERNFFKREASTFDELFHNGAFSKGKGVQVVTNCDSVA